MIAISKQEILMTELKPFLVRLRPHVKTLLEQASKDQSKSIAAIINDKIEESLGPDADLNTRLGKMLNG
jgi:hypothetical protein